MGFHLEAAPSALTVLPPTVVGWREAAEVKKLVDIEFGEGIVHDQSRREPSYIYHLPTANNQVKSCYALCVDRIRLGSSGQRHMMVCRTTFVLTNHVW